MYLVEEVRAQTSIAAEPFVRSVLAALNDVPGNHATPVAQWRLPRQLHRVLVLVLPGQVQRGAGRFCGHMTPKLV